MIDQDTIILAIAFITTYPTLEKYVESLHPMYDVDRKYIAGWKQSWKERKDISDTALINGYKQINNRSNES